MPRKSTETDGKNSTIGITKWNTIQIDKTPVDDQGRNTTESSITTQELKMTHNIASEF